MGCRRIAAGGALVAALAAPTPAVAQDILQRVDLRTAPVVPMVLATAASGAGGAAAIGDFDGDGAADVAIGAFNATVRGRKSAGAVEVRFGPIRKHPPRLLILGAATGDHTGFSLANAGDVDGDGSDDLIIGAYEASPRGRLTAGSVYLVYGRGEGTLDLANPGVQALRIDGPLRRDNIGQSVAAAGDQDGDGAPDILIGSPGADPFGRGRAGAAWIVHGQGGGGTVDLASPDAQATQLAGAEEVGAAGWSVAGGKDFDGDGRPDLAIGAPEDGTVDTNTGPGAVYLVRGPANTGGVQDLSLPSPNLLEIHGPFAGDLFGWSLAMTGDMNGDKRGDLAVGAWNYPPYKRDQGGSVFVVNGTPTTGTVVAASGGKRGYRIDGADDSARAGRAVAAAGDLDGDGVPDLVVGSSGLGSLGRDFVGAADIVYGAQREDPVDLSELNLGMHIEGVHTNDRTGDALAAGGDLDGDGRPDVIVGAPNMGEDRQGGAYLVSDPAPVVLTLARKSSSCTRPSVMIGVNARATVRVTSRVGKGRKRTRTVRWRGPDRHAVSVLRPYGARAGAVMRVDVSARGEAGQPAFAYLRTKLRCG
jgi:hypothetical protein